MPRLDNSNQANLELVQKWGHPRWQDVTIDLEDIGETPPMDICADCYIELRCTDDVAHPSYEDGEYYKCVLCDWTLSDDDANPPVLK